MRCVLVIPLLVATTHGMALWLGSRPKQEPDSPARTMELGSPAHVIASVTTWQDLLQKAKIRQEQDQERAAAAPSRDELIAQARASIPADADLEALVRAGCPGGFEEDASAESMAAFGLWMDRDPQAALKWHRGQYPNSNSFYGSEIERHFRNGGLRHLEEYIDASPGSRDELIAYAGNVAAEDGGIGALALAFRLGSMDDRLKMVMRFVLPSDGFASRLPEIRGLLDDGHLASLMSVMGSEEEDLSEAFRLAGFPEASILRYQRKFAFLEDRQARLAIEEAEEASKPLATRIQNSESNWIRKMGYAQALLDEVPALEEWTRDFRDQRITASELYSRITGAISDGSQLDRELGTHFLDKNFSADPMGCTDWLKSHRQDWQETLSLGLGWDGEQSFHGSIEGSCSPEEWLSLANSLEDEPQLAAAVELELSASYHNWHRENAGDCERHLRQQPPGPFRDKLLGGFGKEDQ